MHLFELWLDTSGTNPKKCNLVIELVEKYILKEGYTFETTSLRKCIAYTCKKIVDFWKKCKRNHNGVRKNYAKWLMDKETILVWPISPVSDSKYRGRPKLDFSECSKRSKRRRIAYLSEVDDTAVNILRNEYQNNLAPADCNEVLYLIMETEMSKHQYLLVRKFINTKLAFKLFPSYENILAAKKKRYPEQISVSESHAEVELQSLLDNTASCILELQKSVIESITDSSADKLTLVGKWGFDGSTGHSEYKQKFFNNDLEDRSLFVTSYVPIRLVSEAKNKIIWKNPRPSSTRYCRPVRFQFKKETTEVSVKEEKYIKDKITMLKPTEFNLPKKRIIVKHSLHLTMVDGKVCNALSQSSSAKCYLCGAKPTEMNNLEKCLDKEIREKYFEFGLSPLHSYIRFFEYFLHISYKLDVKMWQVRDGVQIKKILQRKLKIQTEFREKMGINVDKPRDGGRGSSNDGNVARKFFSNPSLAADITGVSENLIHRCATILQAMASGYKINPDKFNTYALDTAKELIKAYPWYYLPASVHKVLLHGSDVIKHALVSIGELSEEAAEANNKIIKKCRLQHSRKNSRILTNLDMMNLLLLRSDPFITGQRELGKSEKSILMKSVYQLLEDTM